MHNGFLRNEALIVTLARNVIRILWSRIQPSFTFGDKPNVKDEFFHYKLNDAWNLLQVTCSIYLTVFMSSSIALVHLELTTIVAVYPSWLGNPSELDWLHQRTQIPKITRWPTCVSSPFYSLSLINFGFSLFSFFPGFLTFCLHPQTCVFIQLCHGDPFRVFWKGLKHPQIPNVSLRATFFNFETILI